MLIFRSIYFLWSYCSFHFIKYKGVHLCIYKSFSLLHCVSDYNVWVVHFTTCCYSYRAILKQGHRGLVEVVFGMESSLKETLPIFTDCHMSLPKNASTMMPSKLEIFLTIIAPSKTNALDSLASLQIEQFPRILNPSYSTKTEAHHSKKFKAWCVTLIVEAMISHTI